MAGISEVVANSPGAVFAVDEQLQIVAWNHAAERGLGLAAEAVLGTACYETVHAVDADTGRPCHEHCPLLHRSANTLGWVHSRVLKARWRGGKPVHLDCMLLHCVLPNAEIGTLSFVTPLDASKAEENLRALSAMETLYPMMTRAADVTSSLENVVRATLQGTNADVAELELVDPDHHEAFHVVRQTLLPIQQPYVKALPKVEDLLTLRGGSPAALVVFHPLVEGGSAPGDGLRWSVTVPLAAQDRILGSLSVASKKTTFNAGAAARVLFAVGGQLSVYLRWALMEEQQPTGAKVPGTLEAQVLRFYCLGRFRIVLNGDTVPLTRFKRHKSLLLLKALASHRGRPFHRETLIELLWPGADPSVVSNNLRVVLHDVRHTLEPGLEKGKASSFVLSQGDLVYLDPTERCSTDVEEFEHLAKKCNALVAEGRDDEALAAGQEAVALYGGEYLEDEPYTDWCIEERERLRELYVALLRHMGLIHASHQRFEEGILACRAALAADNLKEEIHRRLIEWLGYAGRRDEALRQYGICRELLREELGVAPDEQTQRVYWSVIGQGVEEVAEEAR